jgi:perosamine synthetase
MTPRRTLPPVGYQVPAARVLHAAFGAAGASREAFERSVESALGTPCAVAVSSGKAALTLILRTLAAQSPRRKVVIPAYTCFSVPSAVVKAGLEVVPCDVSQGGLDYDYDTLHSLLGDDVLCVVSVHLFGVPADTPRVVEACRTHGIAVIEDAAQAMGALVAGAPAGTTGDAGVLSLGRGKNVTCGSGGVALARHAGLADRLRAEASALAEPSRGDDLTTAGMLLALTVFLRPNLYWIPAGLPFLKLGETVFHEDFPMRRLSQRQAMLMSNWQEDLAALVSIRREHGGYYATHVRASCPGRAGDAYLRYPVVLPDDGSKARVLDRGAELGVSAMYPASVCAIPQLAPSLGHIAVPNADRLARTLVTLPTHPFVTATDRERIAALVNQSSGTAVGRAAADPKEADMTNSSLIA